MSATTIARSIGGWVPFRLISAASTNATLVKDKPGVIGQIACSNNGASAAYLKIYDKASAPTVGTDVTVFAQMIPAGSGFVIPEPLSGLVFATGIAIAVTGGAADSDTTAVTANQVLVNIGYR